jgi:hypothetical protein
LKFRTRVAFASIQEIRLGGFAIEHDGSMPSALTPWPGPGPSAIPAQVIFEDF